MFVSHHTPTPPKPQIMGELSLFLEEKGHTCVKITNNHEFIWCQQDVCSEIQKINQQNQQQKEDDLVVDLKDKGHTCIQIKETYPTQTVWCKQDPCKNK